MTLVQLWTADPQTFREDIPGDLTALLDEAEQARAAKFRLEADRRPYVLAHALRRGALARALGLSPSDISFLTEPNGRPLLTGPRAHAIHFSHSRTRNGVACAVTSAGPVGIDLEILQPANVDFSILAPYLILPPAQQRAAELGPDAVLQFYFYWTALEAFWKAMGRGLSPVNPRIRCHRNAMGAFHITPDGEPGTRARLITVPSSLPCMMSVAIEQHETQESWPAEQTFEVEMLHCNSTSEISRLAPAGCAYERLVVYHRS